MHDGRRTGDGDEDRSEQRDLRKVIASIGEVGSLRGVNSLPSSTWRTLGTRAHLLDRIGESFPGYCTRWEHSR